jgi:glycosyltransferase involved in cell wall biosynthesis
MYYRRLLSAPQYVVCPSNYVAEYFRQWTGRRADQILAVPNGIVLPPALTNGNGWRPPKGRSLRLAFLGSVTEHKGVHVILEAAALSATPLELDVYGPADPHYARQLRARAMTIPHLQLRLHGAYEPSQLSSMLHDIDCVVAPSQWPETFLLVTREAMARGVPVIVSRLGALPDAVCEGQNGFSFTHDRPEELAALLDRVTTDTGLLPALRKNARETRILSVAEHTEIVRGIYRRAMTDLAAGGGGTAGGDLAELDVIYQCLSGDREGVAC